MARSPAVAQVALVGMALFFAFGLSSDAGASTLPEDEGEPFAPSEPQTQCDPTEKPGPKIFRSYILTRFGGYDDGIIRACDQGGTSEHKEGRAWDWGITAYAGKPEARVNEALDAILSRNALLFRRAGLLYMIYNRRIWSGSGARTWVPYAGENPHTDHVHFSFSWAGAKALTSFYQGKSV